MDNATKLVASALLGKDVKIIVVNGKGYVINPPTIKAIAGAGYHLSEMGSAETLHDMLSAFKDMGRLCKALSFFICGDESKADELMEGTLDEVVAGIETAVNMLSVENFLMLSVLTRNVEMLIATPKRQETRQCSDR